MENHRRGKRPSFETRPTLLTVDLPFQSLELDPFILDILDIYRGVRTVDSLDIGYRGESCRYPIARELRPGAPG